MIRVLIVDDSATVRKVLTEQLRQFEDIEVVGTAVDPYAAREKIVQLNPDVVTLDVEMPRMDGLTFLAKLMKYHPMPVVVVSSLTPENSAEALRALELGAVEVVPKPGSVYSTPDVHRDLIRALRAAAAARPRALSSRPGGAERPPSTELRTTDRVIAIGASTGGTTAIERLLVGLPPTVPGIAIVQHLPGTFTAAFASRLDRVCSLEVREARDRDDLAAGLVLVAPANQHMIVERDGARYRVRLRTGPRVHYQRPSVDVLFGSVATSVGANAIGVLLTGMGADGARGLLAMRQAGAYTLVEAEESCVVYGMPRVAAELGAAREVVPLDRMARALLRALTRERRSGGQASVSR